MASRTTKTTPTAALAIAPSAVKMSAQVLSKDAFSRSGLPGSELLKQTPVKYSLAQTFLLAALGAGVGALVGKTSGRSVGASAGIGAALAGGGSLAYQTMASKADYAVEGAVSVGSATAMLMSPVAVTPKGTLVTPGKMVDRVTPVLMSGPLSADPIGWLGGLAAHGNLVQALQMSYVNSRNDASKNTHVHPGLRFRRREYGEGAPCDLKFVGETLADSCSKDFHTDDSELFTSRFCEWPSPAFRMWFGPMEDYALERPDYSNSQWLQYPGRMIRDYLWGIDGQRYNIKRKPRWETHAGEGKGLKDYMAAVNRYQKQHAPKNFQNFDANMAMAARLLPAPVELPGVALWDTKIVRPSWVSSSEVASFNKRLWHYYMASRWYVWAGEMMRLHSSGSRFLAPSTQWRDHCLLWGIGVPDLTQALNRKNMVEWYSKQQLDTEMTGKQVTRVLEALMRATPPPGSPEYNGVQITRPGLGRVMMDIPERAGTINPPVWFDLNEWFAHRAYKWSEVLNPWEVVGRVFTSLIQVAAKVVSGVVSCGALTAAIEIIQCVSDIIQLGYKWLVLHDVDLEDFGDLVGIAGKANGALQLDLDIGDTISPTTQQLMKDFSNGVDILKNTYKWNYTNEAYAGMISDKNLADILKAQGLV